MSNRFLAIVLIIVAIFVGLLFVGKKDASAPTGNNSATTVQPTNHTEGKGTSGVTLTEYGDFQCPACGAYYPIVKQVQQKYGDQITFQFRNFPLSIHQNARAAHRAAEAADKQGKFWEMHDMLYERQKSWESSSNPAAIFEGYASELGLNIDQFKADVASSAINDIINADVQAGQALKITATPTFAINGKKIDNPRDIEGFYKLIDDAIASAKKDQPANQQPQQ
jgi:protein-disulfide isomerase